MPPHPQPRVRNKVKHTSIVTTVTAGFTRRSRTQWFTAYFVLFPVIGLSCHRRQWCCHRWLDAGVEASGPHDFAVRKHALFVNSATCVHRIPPRVRDDRETPLWWDEMGRACKDDLPDRTSEIFLKKRLGKSGEQSAE